MGFHEDDRIRNKNKCYNKSYINIVFNQDGVHINNTIPFYEDIEELKYNISKILDDINNYSKDKKAIEK